MPYYAPPDLNQWLSNLAGILPLSALIEFVDVTRILHSYELSGRQLLWNWPITPAGARLLLSTAGCNKSACCLDAVGHAVPLQCIDGRWGDLYPCRSQFTVRTAISQAGTALRYKTQRDTKGLRIQTLEVVRVSQADNKHSIDKWVLIEILGWLLWLGVLIASLLGGLWYASAYLVLLVLTGGVVRYSHGHKVRPLLDTTPSNFTRMVVLCHSMNANEWTALVGGHQVVDSLLNKPLYQVKSKNSIFNAPPIVFALALRLLVSGQWTLVVLACAFQGWDALVISAWIIVCKMISTFFYNEHNSVQDWLASNRVHMEKAEMVFDTRRSMLSALVTINPDRSKTRWIDPILAPSDDRTGWEKAILGYLETGNIVQGAEAMYWWPFLDEGVNAARQVETWLGKSGNTNSGVQQF